MGTVGDVADCGNDDGSTENSSLPCNCNGDTCSGENKYCSKSKTAGSRCSTEAAGSTCDTTCKLVCKEAQDKDAQKCDADAGKYCESVTEAGSNKCDVVDHDKCTAPEEGQTIKCR